MSEILEFIITQIDQTKETKDFNIIRVFNGITHLEVYQQHIYNFCGYHATFNILQLLQYLNGKQTYLYDGISFWKYVYQVQRYLKQYRTKLSLNHEPWRNHEIEHGDFERSYLKPWKQMYHDVVVIQYQFSRIVNSLQEREHIAKQIDKYKHSSDIIIPFMLGITFHWVSFVAVKKNNVPQFYLMDSKNLDYCEWSVQQIQEYLSEINDKRTKAGRIPFKPYELDMYQCGIQDLQGLVKLMADFLTGNKDFKEYTSDSATLMYIKPLYEMMGMTEEQFLEANIEIFDKEMIQIWTSEYKHTIQSVFKEQQIVFSRSRKLLTKLQQILENIHNQIGQQEVHNPFQQCHDIITGCVESFTYEWSSQHKQKQINIYLSDSTKTEHYSYLIDLKKVYVREFVTKLHHYYLRLQFYENIFHPQGGGQPDDIGSIKIGDQQFQIMNMYNDRQQQESYVDITFSQSTYELLLKCRNHKTQILQTVNAENRLYLSKLHSAGHLLYSELVKLNPRIRYTRGQHFPKETYIQIESEAPLQIPEYLTFDNLKLTISYLTHDQVHEALGYIPEFVEFAEIVRWIKLRDNDRGFPCNGTHTTEVNHINITNIVTNQNEYKIYYSL